ncbi:hypothetical protein [Geothermobacter hydrogeniphilus]|uniref:Uncharacterized protein n=1 Tax=Geothermobacter hydrogeniphilus TaxID=1969733 RepID=A0A1X0YB08_9BACT|nr:hypothetical protein [Geothermobacter hydrogeniphilus]ORJ62174.1 hypothetical protein B5V00_05350 [Geothermobacter hydrogeniphilus]
MQLASAANAYTVTISNRSPQGVGAPEKTLSQPASSDRKSSGPDRVSISREARELAARQSPGNRLPDAGLSASAYQPSLSPPPTANLPVSSPAKAAGPQLSNNQQPVETDQKPQTRLNIRI